MLTMHTYRVLMDPDSSGGAQDSTVHQAEGGHGDGCQAEY